jgi:hypothetical protein
MNNPEFNQQSGRIGDFFIRSDGFTDSADSMGISSFLSSADDVRFWAGATYENRATAPFRVTRAGALASTSGVIGGFTIGATGITAASGNNKVELTSDVTGKPNNAALFLGDPSGADIWTSLSYKELRFSDGAADEPILLYVDTTTNNRGLLKLGSDLFASPQIELQGDTGLIYTSGDIESDGGVFRSNGVDGYSGTFDPAAVTSIVVSGGIITSVT